MRTSISHLVRTSHGWQSRVRLCRRKAGRGRGSEVSVVIASEFGSQLSRSVLGPRESTGSDADLEKSESLCGTKPAAGRTVSRSSATSHAIMAAGRT